MISLFGLYWVFFKFGLLCFGGGYMLAFGNPITGEPMGAYGFWSATAAGLWLTGISLACMAIWVGRQFARDDNHTPEEIEEAVKVSRA